MPPLLRTSARRLVSVGEAVIFDAVLSSDEDGALTGFAWDFGDK
jgi:hypothetical protein